MWWVAAHIAGNNEHNIFDGALDLCGIYLLDRKSLGAGYRIGVGCTFAKAFIWSCFCIWYWAGEPRLLIASRRVEEVRVGSRKTGSAPAWTPMSSMRFRMGSKGKWRRRGLHLLSENRTERHISQPNADRWEPGLTHVSIFIRKLTPRQMWLIMPHSHTAWQAMPGEQKHPANAEQRSWCDLRKDRV